MNPQFFAKYTKKNSVVAKNANFTFEHQKSYSLFAKNAKNQETTSEIRFYSGLYHGNFGLEIMKNKIA
jgi:hypothetical protein